VGRCADAHRPLCQTLGVQKNMKRNWDTIREILLRAEALEPDTTLRLSDFDENRSDEIAYHVKLLKEAELIQVSIAEFLGGAGIHFDLERLTWSAR
jgi:Hypothetical protein (DUF2513)